jgi:hypothetical protein
MKKTLGKGKDKKNQQKKGALLRPHFQVITDSDLSYLDGTNIKKISYV